MANQYSKNNFMPKFQPLDLFQGWKNRDFLIMSAVDLKVLELPKEDGRMALE
jgi:hypothetical protein